MNIMPILWVSKAEVTESNVPERLNTAHHKTKLRLNLRLKSCRWNVVMQILKELSLRGCDLNHSAFILGG